MRLTKKPFEQIANGEKIIESRLHDEKRQKLAVGDTIEFTLLDDPSRTITTRVLALYGYPTFKELFDHFEPSVFGGTSKKSLTNDIKKYYSDYDEQKYGVVGIKIEKIK